VAPRVSFRHLSGPRQGQVDEVPLPALIGSEAGTGVNMPGTAAHHALVFERDHELVLQDGGSGTGTLLEGEPIQEAVLRPGDVLELGRGGPRLCLVGWDGARAPGGTRTASVPVPPSLLERAHRFFLGIHRRTSPAFRIAVPFALAAGSLLLVFSQWQTYHVREELARLREALHVAERERVQFYTRIQEERSRFEADRATLEGHVAELRDREEKLTRQLSEEAAGEVTTVRQDLLDTRERLSSLESERAAAERIIRDYGHGVCLIQGAYAFYDKDARPLRYRLDEDERMMRGEDGQPLLDPLGKGEVHVVDYFGTGFLVDRRGLLLTNRHVAEPWWNDDTAESLGAKGYKPRFTLFRAFFPREPEPFVLEIVRHDETVDLSLLRIEARGHRIPTLPLDATRRGAVPGQPVVVVGYPAGLEALLAKTDGRMVKEILAAAGTSSERITEVLSKRALIRPSTTQGHIGDVTKSDIVFDAPTTQGGSGGPVLNRDGVVIAVEYAVLSKFGGNSFGIPIGYALDLMKDKKPRPR
jgi:hypothetical protein